VLRDNQPAIKMCQPDRMK